MLLTTAHLRRFFSSIQMLYGCRTTWMTQHTSHQNDGTFIGLRLMQSLYVEGPPVRPSAHALSSTFASAVAEHTHPQFRSVVSGLGKRASSSANTSCRVKVVKADVNWNSKMNKPSFTPSHQAFIEVQESTATVDYITDEIKKKLGDSYVLVTNDGGNK